MISLMTEANVELELASRLCLACGLCCDGTIYATARIQEDEIRQTADIGLETLRLPDERPGFSLPCHYLNGCACTRYDAWRPSVCAKYFCQVQKRAKSGELAETEAFARVKQAVSLRDQVAPLLPAGMTIAEARDHFRKLAANRAELGPADGQFIVRMFVLERFLDNEFRAPNKGHLPQGQSDELQP
jgi:uncharacterized protein